MILGRVEISGGALLVWALLYYMDNSGAALWVLRLTFAGAELRLSAAREMPHGRMMLVTLAGPMTNLLLALFSMVLARHGVGERLYLFAGINLGLAVFNLLPAGWLDGGMLLREALIWVGWGNGSQVFAPPSLPACCWGWGVSSCGTARGRTSLCCWRAGGCFGGRGGSGKGAFIKNR